MAQLRVSLFWRTFLLIGGLIIVSVVASLQMARELDVAPPEQKLAWEIASIVNLTRSALVSSQEDRRRALLDELAREERVRVVPLEPFDRIEALPDTPISHGLERRLQASVGPRTVVAGRVNGGAGLWVSFDIDGDDYWLVLSLDRLKRQLGPPWWSITFIALAMAMLGALVISRHVNRPLAGLATAISKVSTGAPSTALPEQGPSEIAALNRRFNQMANDLAELEADRAVALAGISHDIRTPLTRLRMEIELSLLSDDDKASMAADIERIDGIVGKFVEYGRTGAVDPHALRSEPVDVALVASTVADGYRAQSESGEIAMALSIEPGLRWIGDPLDLARMLSNPIENALRYGHAEGEPARIEVSARRQMGAIVIEIRDRGPGVPADQIERLMRPFARLDHERSDRGGSGLGLAIVSRLARRHQGVCRLSNHPEGGLVVQIELPDTRRNA